MSRFRAWALVAAGVTSTLLVPRTLPAAARARATAGPSAAAALLPITAAGFQTSRTLRPGDARVEVYRLVLVNTNVLLGTDQVTDVTFQNRVQGGGSTTQQDADWQSLTLAASSRASDVLTPGVGAPLATASFSGGTLRFSGLNLSLAPGDSVYVVVAGAPSLLARDADALDLRIASTAAIRTANNTTVNVANGGTLDPAGSFPVDGMSAAQIQLQPVTTPYFSVGATGQLALAFRVPPNGWQDDRIQRIEIVSRGSAQGGTDLQRMDAWLDNGDGVFSAGQEAFLGTPVFTGSSWVLGGLATDVAAPAGAWIFVTVDIAPTATENATLRLALPPFGLDMLSANDGPNDKEVGNPVQQVISFADHVVVSPLTLASGTATPGATDLPLVGLELTNAYAGTRTLQGLALTNTTSGPGSIAERDAELQRVQLRLDGNGDRVLGDVATDPVLASAVYSGGHALFSGFTLPLGAGAKRGLFLTGDLAPLRSADGDRVAAAVHGREDLQFAEPGTAVSGGFPLVSDDDWTVDGMVAAQVGNTGVPPFSIGPGDGPVETLDLLVRRNGYLDDVLEGLKVTNLGTAVSADLASVRLWRDGGDGSFDHGAGDDLDLGVMSPGGAAWTSAPLSVALGAAGARLFVAVTASGTPTDGATVRMAAPVGGIVVASGNDGPLDAPVANPDELVLANRGLIASLAFDAPTVSVSQVATLTMSVRSTSSETLLGVAPGVPSLSGGGSLTPLTGPSPASADLAPGASASFAWTYSASAAGNVRASANASGTGATSGQPVASLDAQSGVLRVMAPADSVKLAVAEAMPQSVTRGQRGVLPLYLTFTHPDSEGSPIRIDRLRVRLEREDGSDVPPASLLSRALVLAASETLLVRSSLEASGGMLDLPLARPAIVGGHDPAALVLALDVASSTVVPDFRVVLVSATDVEAADDASGVPVPVRLQGSAWPVPSGLARVLAGATELDVSAPPMPPVRAGRGQVGLTLGSFELQSPGVAGVTTDVRVGALDIKLSDTLGARLAKPGLIVRRLRLRSATQTLADRLVAPGADSVIALTLSPLLSVPVNTAIPMLLVADLSDTASLGDFRLELGDSARFDARDPNTGNRVPVAYAVRPLRGPVVTVERRADSVFVLGVPRLPADIGLGARAVQALSLVLRHPGLPGSGRLRLDTLVVRCLDGSGASLVPATFVDRMQVFWNDSLVAAVPDPPASGSTMLVPLPSPAIEPGDTARVTLVLDFEPAAPAGTFAIAVGATGIGARDANLGTPAVAAVENGGEFPLLSGITRLVPPSRLLESDLADAMPAVLATDGLEVVAGRIVLENSATPGSGPVRVRHLVVHARGPGGPVTLGAAVSRVSLALGGTTFGSSATLGPDSTTALVAFPTELSLDAGQPVELELRFNTRPDPSVGTFALGFRDTDVGVVQPGNPLLDVTVLPAPGRTFPLETASASYSSASLADSWSSFPNPFSPARGGATFAFYLAGPARVSLDVWTGRGERVLRLLDDRALTPGLHQDVRWDGRNGSGALVQSGVYVAELVVRFDGGRTESIRRKVAVVR